MYDIWTEVACLLCMKYDKPMWCYQSDIDTDTGSHPHPTGYE